MQMSMVLRGVLIFMPRKCSETSVTHIMLMRKMEYRKPYMAEASRPLKVYNAAKFLAATDLYKEKNILLVVVDS